MQIARPRSPYLVSPIIFLILGPLFGYLVFAAVWGGFVNLILGLFGYRALTAWWIIYWSGAVPAFASMCGFLVAKRVGGSAAALVAAAVFAPLGTMIHPGTVFARLLGRGPLYATIIAGFLCACVVLWLTRQFGGTNPEEAEVHSE
jgi:hypothetical protein